MNFNNSIEIYGSARDRLGLGQSLMGGGAAWSGVIDVPRNKTHLYAAMPPPGGRSAKNPAVCINDLTGHEVEVSFVRGKKKLKRVRLKEDEKRKITKDEALENPKKMFKYLKQYNKEQDMEWEAQELAAYDSS
jgi:predicted DNA-binding antitoxin AbrB/MazE fold protein